jgi:hypothetical protein
MNPAVGCRGLVLVGKMRLVQTLQARHTMVVAAKREQQKAQITAAIRPGTRPPQSIPK